MLYLTQFFNDLKFNFFNSKIANLVCGGTIITSLIIVLVIVLIIYFMYPKFKLKKKINFIFFSFLSVFIILFIHDSIHISKYEKDKITGAGFSIKKGGVEITDEENAPIKSLMGIEKKEVVEKVEKVEESKGLDNKSPIDKYLQIPGNEEENESSVFKGGMFMYD